MSKTACPLESSGMLLLLRAVQLSWTNMARELARPISTADWESVSLSTLQLTVMPTSAQESSIDHIGDVSHDLFPLFPSDRIHDSHSLPRALLSFWTGAGPARGEEHLVLSCQTYQRARLERPS